MKNISDKNFLNYLYCKTFSNEYTAYFKFQR